jgi:hypothetical protein
MDIPDPLSHRLKVLSVRVEQVQLEQQLLFNVARYLDSIFPKLESIKTHEQAMGNYAGQWRFIFDIMKAFQAVRLNEQERLASCNRI